MDKMPEWKCPNNSRGTCLLSIAGICKYNKTYCKMNNFTDYLLMSLLREK